MYSWEYNILVTLLRHKAGSLQDTVKIKLGFAVILSRGRSHDHQLRGLHLRPVHLGTGEGHSRAFNADLPLDGIQLRAGINQPLHETKVAAGDGFGKP